MDHANDIERLYEESLREDLEWISAHAMPSIHWYPTSPFPHGAAAYTGMGGATSAGSTRVYSQAIPLKVIKIDLADFNLAAVGADRTDASRAKDESEFMHHWSRSQDLALPADDRDQERDFAMHAYMGEGLVLNIVTKAWHIPAGANPIPEPLIITFEYVDYLRTDMGDFAALKQDGHIQVPNKGYAARWPETITYHHLETVVVNFKRSDLF